MFCTQCGTNNPEGAAHCVTCGAPMGTPVAPKKSFDIKEMFNKVRSHKLFWPGVGAAALIIILLIVFGNTKTTPINNYIKGIVKADVNAFMSVYPKEYFEDADKSEIKEYLKYAQEDLQDEYGRNAKATFKKTDEEKWDKDDLKDFRKTAERYYDLDGDKITEVWTIEGEITTKGSEGKDTEDVEFTVYKYKGKWYLWR